MGDLRAFVYPGKAENYTAKAERFLKSDAVGREHEPPRRHYWPGPNDGVQADVTLRCTPPQSLR